jgi:hypothetical protein
MDREGMLAYLTGTVGRKLPVNTGCCESFCPVERTGIAAILRASSSADVNRLWKQPIKGAYCAKIHF